MTSLNDLHQHGQDPAPIPSPEPAPSVASRILDVVMVIARAPVYLGVLLPIALVLEAFRAAGTRAASGLDHLEDLNHALATALHPRVWKHLRKSGVTIWRLQCSEAFWKDTAERLRKENESLRRPPPTGEEAV